MRITYFNSRMYLNKQGTPSVLAFIVNGPGNATVVACCKKTYTTTLVSGTNPLNKSSLNTFSKLVTVSRLALVAWSWKTNRMHTTNLYSQGIQSYLNQTISRVLDSRYYKLKKKNKLGNSISWLMPHMIKFMYHLAKSTALYQYLRACQVLQTILRDLYTVADSAVLELISFSISLYMWMNIYIVLGGQMKHVKVALMNALRMCVTSFHSMSEEASCDWFV